MIDNELNSKRYFIFKFLEYTQRKYRLIENKRNDSIVLLFRECSDIFNEYYESKSDSIKAVLKVSLEKMLDIIKFYSKNNPFIKYSTLNNEFQYLVSLVEDSDNKNRIESIYYSLISLQKKIKSADLIGLHIKIIKNNNLKFSEVDGMLDSIFNELISKGYSLRYLGEWYKSNILDHQDIQKVNEKDVIAVQQLLDMFNKLSSSEKKFSIIFYVSLDQDNITKIKSEKQLKIGNNNIFHVCTDDEIKFFEEKLLLEKIPKDYKSSKVVFLKIEKESVDKYNAIQDTYKSLDKYLNLYTIINSYKDVIGNYCIVAENSTNWSNQNISDLAHSKLMKNLSIKEKKYIADLISLRSELINKKDNYKNIMILERSLQALINSSKYSTENTLLDMWTVLELFVYEYNASSIIEKVRSIVPKVICLYAIKEIINTFWNRVQDKKKHIGFNDPIISEFITRCDGGEGHTKYNLMELINILNDEEMVKKLYEAFSFNINIQRDIAEISCLLKNTKIGKSNDTTTKKYIEELHETILHDIDRIYRVRNKIVHHGDEIQENLETVVERLFRYVNSLINLFIHHIKENPELTIAEILYSITNTYNWYIDFLKKNDRDKFKEIAAPTKLFLL